ncbi:DegT/DnrJ/EryC1/StrS family aminotransferase [Microcystis wesenbergii]|uniref:DegT/DnrJ/EryC1/StrS family aminotransferase n=1 Tax=Microcystis wesenbergii NRERC-220 TaxID=3068991 RepID=A0ABU3HMN5_9CHRO|nr:DegT/DnrJ/EryC1/StrS family aminotransferase [Microcystis wesenbergii]MDT3675802.1 DegT/DnrJ/EryC1/StrS family aminotransferase [Microcystis wesenbergii NRERC-220]
MNSNLIKVPFVDLTWQNQPLQAKITEAIQTVIDQGDFVLGQALAEFETAFAQACGVEYAVGVASGTAALALALQAYGIGAGDEVLVPANTFVATLMGVIQAGAKPVLVDCHLDTALIDLSAAAQSITPNTRAILPVHLYGQMVSPQQLQDFARSYNLIIFEDAAQAHLASREGYRAGSVGVAAGFSFYPSKNLGAFGNGGMLVSNDPEISQKARSLRNYGAPSKYFHTAIGTNSRLDSIQAAILNVKLPHLEGWNRYRQRAARQYDQLLAPLADQGILPIRDETETGHVYHLYVIRILAHCPVDRQQLQKQLAAVGIQTGIHYPIPCHLQPAYRYLGYQQGDFPHAEILCEEIVSLPMYPGISEEQIEIVVEQITAIIG